MKQAIVVRSDLGMGKGKLAAQAAHASLSAAELTSTSRPGWYEDWKSEGQKKVVLKVGSESELDELYKMARRAKLPAALVADRGLTQVEPGTVTCLGIGPAPDTEIDVVTGKLKLL